MAKKEEEKVYTSITLNVRSGLIDEMLAKKFFRKVPISDNDYLYSLFTFGILKSKTDIDEFNVYVQLLQDMGKVSKIDIENA